MHNSVWPVHGPVNVLAASVAGTATSEAAPREPVPARSAGVRPVMAGQTSGAWSSSCLTAALPTAQPPWPEDERLASSPRPRPVRAAEVAGGDDAAGLAAAGCRCSRVAPPERPRLRRSRRDPSTRLLVFQPARISERGADRTRAGPCARSGGVRAALGGPAPALGVRGRRAAPRPAHRLTSPAPRRTCPPTPRLDSFPRCVRAREVAKSRPGRFLPCAFAHGS